jgi:hypothetical protein
VVTTVEEAPDNSRDDDPFLLRNLVWCELCKRPMEPSITVSNRSYVCESEACPTVMVPAGGLEDAVWQQYVLLYEAIEQVIPTAMRWATLRQRLARLWVGEDVWEVWGEWRE